MSTLPLLEDEMHRLVGEAQQQRIFLRLIGGLAVKTHCDRATHRALMRDYPDIDFVTDKSGAMRLEGVSGRHGVHAEQDVQHAQR